MTDKPNAASLEIMGAVLGRTPSGIFILTARSASGEETGMLASWVQQASFEPPAVTLAVNKKRYVNDWLQATGEAALSLVGESQKQFLSHFSKGFEPHEPAFSGVQTTRAGNGLTVLSDALGWMSGRITGRIDAGDHWIYAMHISDAGRGEALEREKPWVHLRKNGFGY